MVQRKPTDSPWFWFCLFATAGLILLVIIQSKFENRQTGIEKRFAGRTWMATNSKEAGSEKTKGSAASKDLPSSETGDFTRRLKLKPLVWILAGVVIFGWLSYWYSVKRFEPEK